MRKIFLGINYGALIGALVAWAGAAVTVPMVARARVTELDRVGVFDETKLREHSPALAENLRHNVADWIQGPMQSAAIRSSYWLAALAAVNVVGLHLLGRNERRSANAA